LLAAGSLSDRTDDGTVSGHVVSILGLISAVNKGGHPSRVEHRLQAPHYLASDRHPVGNPCKDWRTNAGGWWRQCHCQSCANCWLYAV